MFVPEEEAVRRITSEENLVNRVSRDSPEPALPVEILPPAIDDFDLSELLEISEQPKNFDRTLAKLLNPDGYSGRGPRGLSRDAQAAIGVTASILGSTKAARLGDVSLSDAHSLERGYTSPNDLVNAAKSPKEDLQNKIIEGHGIVVEKCFGRLLKSLDLLDDTKLASVKKAGELSVIAKNLSGVIAHASQATKETNFDGREQSVHFHIMRPEQARDSDYKTVEISSEREETAYQERARER